jgi:hypothetical protein
MEIATLLTSFTLCALFARPLQLKIAELSSRLIEARPLGNGFPNTVLRSVNLKCVFEDFLFSLFWHDHYSVIIADNQIAGFNPDFAQGNWDIEVLRLNAVFARSHVVSTAEDRIIEFFAGG